jgi:hypothetical protein
MENAKDMTARAAAASRDFVADHARKSAESQVSYRLDASSLRCNRCGSKVDPMEGVVAKVEVRGELARLWHVECWNKDNSIGDRYWR